MGLKMTKKCNRNLKHFRAQSFTSFEANCNMQIALFPKQKKKKLHDDADLFKKTLLLF